MATVEEVADLTFKVQKRKRPDRHPYQIGCLSGLLAVAISQMVVGIPPESALHDTVRYTTVAMLNTTFIIGAFLGLLGAALHRDRDPRLSLRLGIAGQFSVFTGVSTYSIIIISITETPYWLSLLSGGLGIGLTYASAARMWQQWQALRDLKSIVDIIQPDEEGG